MKDEIKWEAHESKCNYHPRTRLNKFSFKNNKLAINQGFHYHTQTMHNLTNEKQHKSS
jgi:hypothetical protein